MPNENNEYRWRQEADDIDGEAPGQTGDAPLSEDAWDPKLASKQEGGVK
jgi:hypothetical protein